MMSQSDENTNLIGRRVYRIAQTGRTSDHEPIYGRTDYRTIKGVLPDGRLITKNRFNFMVVALGEDWKLEE